jgi:hypothetical protein
MFQFGSYQIELMGHPATFDVVTAYGLVCALVFTAGIVIATRIEQRNKAR